MAPTWRARRGAPVTLHVRPHSSLIVTTHTLPQEDQAALIELEEAMWREESRFDLVFQEQRFASDFVEFGRSGRTYTREQIIRSEASPIQVKLPLPNLKVRVLDVNTVQITYDSEATYEGVVEYAHRSSIWSRTEGRWVMRFHQGTPYQPSSPRPGGQSAA
jgi:hypothetical protein